MSWCPETGPDSSDIATLSVFDKKKLPGTMIYENFRGPLRMDDKKIPIV